MIRNTNIRRGPPFATQGQGQFQPPIQRLPFNRTIIPARTYDPLIITQLLLKAATENNLLDLQKFIHENGITTNDMINEDGQSILHLILLNLNLSKRQKLEMIRFFKNQGTLVSSFDKLNQTPLHIACKQQLHEVALELINAGHDVNAVDSSYKTPLHYAVFGKTTDAPQNVDKKILPETKMKLKSEVVPNITKSIIEYIDKTPSLRLIFDNQFNTIQNSKLLFQTEINKIMDSQNTIDKISDIVATPLDNELKQQKIFEVTSDVNKSVKEFINSQLVIAKKQLNMEPNTENGWGPDNLSVNKVLEYGNITDLDNLLTSAQKSLLQNIQDKKRQVDEGINTVTNEIITEIQELQNITLSSIFTLMFLNQINNLEMPGGPPGTPLYDLTMTRLLLTDPEIENTLIYDFARPENQTYYNGSLVLNDLIDFEMGVHSDGTPVDLFRIDQLFFIPNSRFTTPITNLFTDYDVIARSGRLDINGQPHMDLATLSSPGRPFLTIAGNETSIVVLKLITINQTINTILQDLSVAVSNLIINIADPIAFMNNLSDSIIHLLSIVNELPKYYTEYSRVLRTYENIRAIIASKNQQYIVELNGSNHDINILYRSIEADITTSIAKMKRNESGQSTIRFNSIKTYYDIISDCIKYFNTNSSIIFIQKYFNNFGDFNNIMAQVQTDNINNIFNNKIESLSLFFSSYNDIIKFVKPTDDQNDQRINKTKLVEKYLLQLTQKYNYTLISAATPPVAQSRVGVLLGNLRFANLDIDLAQLNLKYGNNGIVGQIQDADATKEAQYNVNAPLQLNKESMSLPIVSVLIDRFIMIQKYFFTRFILDEIYKYIISDAPLAIPAGNNINLLMNDITTLNREISENIKNDRSDKSIIMITIGKILDKIFNANLENIINTTTNDFAYRYVRGELLPRYELTNIQQYNKVDLTNINVNDIYKNIYKLLKRNKYLTLYNYAEDVMVKDVPDKKTYKLMSTYAGDNPVDLYLECDMKLITLLINNGANVNLKDKDGNTPLTIAIINSNKDVVEFLLNQNTSVNSKKSKNRFGLKPLDMCVKNITVLLDNFENEINENAIKSIMNEINQEILKVTKINHNMRFSDIIVKMLIYLINHEIYSRLNSYKHGQTKPVHDAIFSQITTQITELPLLSNIDNVLVKTHKYIKDELNNQQKQLQSNIDNRSKLITEQKSLRDERDDVGVSKYRKDEVRDSLRNNAAEIIALPTADIKQTQKEITQLDELNNTDNTIDFRRIKNELQTINIVNNPLKIYDQVTTKILELDNNDYRTYTLLWTNLFNNKIVSRTSDPTQIINKIFSLLRTNLKQQSKKLDPKKIQVISPITSVFNILTNDINNYFNLPVEYNGENYMLNTCLEIIIHIVNHTMIINLYHVILKLLRTELEGKIPKQTGEDDDVYHAKIDDNVDKIINTTVNNVNLKKYLFEKLGEKLVKICLGIFEDDTDPDKSGNIINLLTFIDKILVANTTISMTRESSKTLKLLNQNVYPYFKNYFDINIKKLKQVTDNYLSMLLGFSTKIEILDKVLQKAVQEK